MKVGKLMIAVAAIGVAPAKAGDWSGLYFGFLGDTSTSVLEVTELGFDPEPGGGEHLTTTDFESSTVETSGMSFGASAGVNADNGVFVLGVEGDFLIKSGVTGADSVIASDYTGGTACSSTCQLSIYDNTVTVTGKSSASLRLRAGIKAGDNSLIYATGGVAWDTVDVSWYGVDQGVTDNFRNTYFGTIVGGGIEIMLAGGWIAGIEYRQSMFDPIMNTSEFNTIAGNTLDVTSQQTSQSILAGLKVLF